MLKVSLALDGNFNNLNEARIRFLSSPQYKKICDEICREIDNMLLGSIGFCSNNHPVINYSDFSCPLCDGRPGAIKLLKEWKHDCLFKNLLLKCTPTGIGLCLKVSCDCGESCDITDLEDW